MLLQFWRSESLCILIQAFRVSLFLFWFKRVHVILGQIWWSFLFFGKVYFVSFVHTLTLLVNSTEEWHICRPQNLFKFYFYINFELNFKSRLHVLFQVHSPFNFSFSLFCKLFFILFYFYFYLFIYFICYYYIILYYTILYYIILYINIYLFIIYYFFFLLTS